YRAAGRRPQNASLTAKRWDSISTTTSVTFSRAATTRSATRAALASRKRRRIENEKLRDRSCRTALDRPRGGRVSASWPQHRVRMGGEREAALPAFGLAHPVPAIGASTVARGTSRLEPESLSDRSVEHTSVL